ncbi:MAG: hypothetical protein IPK96_18510 [Flammeovirgaceae bacterium]|nr:hypothetical protein [Flammeovirgaceae bacterium]
MPYLDNTDAQTLAFTPATSALTISGGNTVTVTATGAAGGDLSSIVPNPVVNTNAITSAKILDGTIVAADLGIASVTDVKIAPGVMVSKLTPSGTNGQVLTTVAGVTTWSTVSDADATNELRLQPRGLQVVI